MNADEVTFCVRYSGTSVGDAMELSVLNKLCQNRTVPLVIGCAKVNIGHGEAVAGLAGIVLKVLISLVQII